MNNNNVNPYETPTSNINPDGKILGLDNFQRFSAWAVFGLTFITLGIYQVYWLYTRTKKVNLFHEPKTSMVWVSFLVIIVIGSFLLGVIGGILQLSPTELATAIIGMAEIVVNVIYLVFYIASVFSLKRTLQEILNTNLNGISPRKLVCIFCFISSVL